MCGVDLNKGKTSDVRARNDDDVDGGVVPTTTERSSPSDGAHEDAGVHQDVAATASSDLSSSSHHHGFQQQQQQQQQHVPNNQLTPDELQAKRRLKKRFAASRRVHKLEQRIRHARSRRDPDVEHKTRLELGKFQEKLRKLEQEEEEALLGSTTEEAPSPDGAAVVTKLRTAPPTADRPARTTALLRRRCQEDVGSLVRRLLSHNVRHEPTSVPEDATRLLLRHMTKGTQSRDMFRDPAALWGYTRHKFSERAMLVVDSFLKLPPATLDHVRSVCSIGCGPGNDAVGLLALLRQQQRTHDHAASTTTTNVTTTHSLLHELVLLDYAMEDWTRILSHTVRLALSGDDHDAHPACRVVLESCDVTRPLDDAVNVRIPSHCDLFLVSYLLSETRGRWEAFVTTLVDRARPGSMFYFAEPTPWQLHRVRTLLDNGNDDHAMDWTWLDSSMHHPELQCLHARLGPAVLFGVKKRR